MIEDTAPDHVRLERRKGTAAPDALGHPADEFEVIDDFHCHLFRDAGRAARRAAGMLDLPPFSAILPAGIPKIVIASDRLRVLCSPTFEEGTLFRFPDAGKPGGGIDEFVEVYLEEDLPR